MQAYILAGPAVEPVPLAEAKAHLRLDGSDEDDLVASLVTAARHAVEAATRLRLVQQTWRVVLDAWPEGRVVRLPLAPVAAIAAVRVVPASGPAATLAPGLSRLDGSADPPRAIVDAAAPEPGAAFGGVELDLVCGFGPAASDVPAPLRLAILRLAARWFADRGDGEGGPMPPDVAALLAPHVRARLVP